MAQTVVGDNILWKHPWTQKFTFAPKFREREHNYRMQEYKYYFTYLYITHIRSTNKKIESINIYVYPWGRTDTHGKNFSYVEVVIVMKWV